MRESGSGNDDFAERLSLALKAANMSGAQLSAAVGVDKSVVSRWLSGHVQPTSFNLARISKALAAAYPGFNMTLWTAPRAQFEAAIGLVSTTAQDTPRAAQPDETASSRRSHSAVWIAAAAAAILLLIGTSTWIALRIAHSRSQAQPSVAAAMPRSVAIMPFVNMSGDPSKDYLGDGIAEELLNDLSNTSNLRVASRTSSFSFKGKNADIGQIARMLHVDTIVEGSARQVGNRIRIVAQLIDARSGFHLWSARYDRELGDILAVQDEIARDIVAALTPKLLPPSAQALVLQARSPAKINPDAYTAYLQGRYAMNRANAEDFVRAAKFFQHAINLQPDFANAHAWLGFSNLVLFVNGERTDTLDRAQQETAAALRLDADNFTALLADATAKGALWKWDEANTALQTLIRDHPNEADAHLSYALLLQNLGLWEKSIGELRRAAELDPMVSSYRENIGVALHVIGHEGDAVQEFHQVLKMDADFLWAIGDMCAANADAGQFNEAEDILRKRLTPGHAEDRSTLYCAALLAYRERKMDRLQQLAATSEHLNARKSLSASWVAFPFAFLGDFDRSMNWLEKAYAQRDYNLFYVIAEPDLPAGIKQTPRWRAFLQRPTFQEIARVRANILARDRAP